MCQIEVIIRLKGTEDQQVKDEEILASHGFDSVLHIVCPLVVGHTENANDLLVARRQNHKGMHWEDKTNNIALLIITQVCLAIPEIIEP